MDIIAIIGLVIALITFIWQFYFNPKEEYSHLKVQFKANQDCLCKYRENLNSI